MPKLYQTASFLKYKLLEINAYSLHSPSMYDLYQNCFKIAKKIPLDPDLEKIRKRLKKDERLIDIHDFGAGSKISQDPKRTVRSIAENGITRSKYSRLFMQIIRYFRFSNIVELGTALGINTMYMARARKEVTVSTFEGSNTLAEIAEHNFNEAGCANINLIKGNIDDTLPGFLMNTNDVDLVFMDANHTYEATMAYFDQIISKLSLQSVMIIDDIYWSPEMTRVWRDIKKRFPKATYIDIFQCGIIIFDENMPPYHMRFAY